MVKKTTKIAVITPCYNRAKFLPECIKSVSLSNTFGLCEIEHIIVDDASTDNSWEILDQLKTPKLRIYKLSQNKGPAFARNFAVSQSAADFIFCLDSDDVLFQNSLFSLLTLALDKKADWVYGDVIRGDRELRYQIGRDFYGWKFNTIEDVLTSMYKNEHFFQGNCLFSRTAFEKAGRYDDTRHIAEDFDLFTRMLLRGYFPYYLPSPLYIFRIHDNNLSQPYFKKIKNHQEDILVLYAKYKDKLKAALSSDSVAAIEKSHLAW
jgi:glycosyltransferase involved in cell wall biosynthesis